MLNAPLKAVIFVLLLVVTACTRPPTPVIVPTLQMLPSLTPSETPTDTPVPTDTPLPTATPTPTDTPSPTLTFTNTAVPTFTPSLTFTASYTYTNTFTPTFTPTSTYTPTDTLTPTATNTYSPTPTPTATFTPTFTPSDTATSTPTFTPTLAAPQILSFGASATDATAGSTVTLAWLAIADSARLEQLTQQGGVMQSLLVTPSGQYTWIAATQSGRAVYFRLTVTRNGIQSSQTIGINVLCQYNWFFGNQYAPANSGCPASGIATDGRYQSFERGVMLYVNANGLNRIYALTYDGSRYVGYINGWDGATLDTTAPPSGRFMPQEMFNWAYYRSLSPTGGSWNAAIGWATANIVGGSRTIQWENAVGGQNPFYIDAPDSAVYRFSGGDSGTWSHLR